TEARLRRISRALLPARIRVLERFRRRAERVLSVQQRREIEMRWRREPRGRIRRIVRVADDAVVAGVEALALLGDGGRSTVAQRLELRFISLGGVRQILERKRKHVSAGEAHHRGAGDLRENLANTTKRYETE